MTVKSLKHKFVSAVADGTDATVWRPSNWNDDHDCWLGMRAATGTSDTIANSDHLTFIRYTNTGAVAVSIPAPSGGNMPSGWTTQLKNVSSSALTLTGTACTINGAPSITLTQGESLQLFSDGSSDYSGTVSLSPNSPSIKGGTPGLKLLNTITIPAGGGGPGIVRDTTSITAAYDSYEFELVNFIPSNNGVGLYAQVMIGGAWLNSGYSSMAMCGYNAGGGGSSLPVGVDTGTFGFLLSGAGYANPVGNASLYGANGLVRLHGANSSVNNKFLSGTIAFYQTGALAISSGVVGGFMLNTNPITGIQFLFGTGNIWQALVRVYGRKTS
jgi:hypothetical protein